MKQFKVGMLMAGLLVMTFTLGSLSSTGEAMPRVSKIVTGLVPTAQTTSSAIVDTGFFNVIDNCVMHCQARVIAIELSTGKTKSFNVQASFKRMAGILEMVGNRVETEFESGDPVTGQWSATIEMDDITDKLFIQVQAGDNQIVEWMAVFEIALYQP